MPKWRSTVVLTLVSIAFSVLLARAVWVQLIDNDFYAEQGRRRFSRVIAIPAARAEILDRNGRLLAISRPVRTIYAMPSAFEAPLDPARRTALAALLDIPLETLSAKLDSQRSFVYLKHRLPLATAAQVEALHIPEVRSEAAWQRYYPDGPALAQVLGFTDADGRGQEGLEAALETQLRSQPGRRTVIRNRVGEIVDNALLEAPRTAPPVRLTIDARIQHAAFGALRDAVALHGAQAGGAVVLDALSGDILALANWPSYDPSDRRARTGSQVRNRVITDVFEPGSVIKPLHIAQALERQWVTPESIFDVSPGWIKLARFTVRDTMPRQQLTVAEILRYSSNVGMVRLMQRETAEAMWSTLDLAGFGKAPPLPFPGAAAGSVRPLAQWSGIDQAAMSYGYGLSVSLLQLARAYTTFGPAGRLLPLSLVDTGPVDHARTDTASASDDAGLVTENALSTGVALPLSPQTAAHIRTMLASVTEPGATAHRARVEGFDVGAKTGTSRKMGSHGYMARRYLATTVGIAPVAAPRFIVAVMIDDPTGTIRGGGVVAAPVFSKIMAETLRLSPLPPD